MSSFSTPALRFSRPPMLDEAGKPIKFIEHTDSLLEKINLRYLYSEGGHLVKLLCPAHNDSSEPNLVVFPRNTHCFACGFHEGAFAHIRRVCGTQSHVEDMAVALELMVDKGDAPLLVTTNLTEPSVKPIQLSLVSSYQDALQGNTSVLAYIQKRYGLRMNTQRQARLGYAMVTKAITIPVYSADGVLSNIKYRSIEEGASMKYWGTAGHNDTCWYYAPTLLKAVGTLKERVTQCYSAPQIFITEGELDALAMGEIDLPAISATGGALSLIGKSDTIDEMFSVLTGLNVILAYDQDEAGQKAASKVASIMAERGLHVQILRWPIYYGKDASELLSIGFNKATFRQACKLTKPISKEQTITLESLYA